VSLKSCVDHLVIAADTLERGVAWCAATLGATPGGGGAHPLMGTHNRVMRISSACYPRAYLEIISVNPHAAAPRGRRWFDLDDPELRRLVQHEPRLVHFVASTEQPAGALKALRRLGIERGPLVRAERATAQGVLRWQISVRQDGQRLFYGGLPTLIEWTGTHPCDSMPASEVALLSLQVCHPRVDQLQAAHEAIGLQEVALGLGAPNLMATLSTPRGPVTLESLGA
jgi:hypothetical protein